MKFNNRKISAGGSSYGIAQPSPNNSEHADNAVVVLFIQIVRSIKIRLIVSVPVTKTRIRLA